MQLCAADVRINCWAKTSAGKTGLVVAWSRWGDAESCLEDPTPRWVMWKAPVVPGSSGEVVEGRGGGLLCFFFFNMDPFKASENVPPGHVWAPDQYQKKAKSRAFI